MAFSVTCPKCRAVLKTAAPVQAGKKVKCPKCGAAFEAPPLPDTTAMTTSPRPAPKGSAAKGSSAASKATEADDEPRSRRRRDEPDDDELPRRENRRDG